MHNIQKYFYKIYKSVNLKQIDSLLAKFQTSEFK